MHNGQRHIRLSAKKLAALVYVGIALLAVGVVSAQTINSVEWFSSVGRLDLQVSQPDFHLDNGTLGYPYVVVLASVHNPSSYGELYLSGANFGVFVNSTTEAFYPLVTRSEEVALSYREVQNNVPARSGLNLTFAVPIIISIVSPLHDFLNNHNLDPCDSLFQVNLWSVQCWLLLPATWECLNSLSIPSPSTAQALRRLTREPSPFSERKQRNSGTLQSWKGHPEL